MGYRPFRKKIIFKGANLRVYSIGWLAILISRHIQTVRDLEYNGILPRPLFEVDKVTKIRYYTAAELKGYAHIYNTFPRQKGVGKRTNWDKLKVAMHTFQQRLREGIKNGTETLPEVIPNEAKLYEAMTTPKDRELKKLAQKLI